MKANRLTALALAALIGGSTLGLAAQHAFAQTPLPSDEDPLDDRSRKRLDKMEKVVRELRAIVFQGRETGKPVVVQPADTDSQIQTLSQRVSDLEATLTRVNGQNEELQHQLDVARQGLAAYQTQIQSLNDRLAPLEQAAQAQAQAAQAEAAKAAENPADAFASAKALMDGGDYDNAEAAFADFVQRHPDDSHAAEANYLYGKALSVRSAHAEAAKAYIEAIRGYPKTSWAPDAMLELSKELIAMKRADDACTTLDTLKAKYPKASATVLKKAAAARTQAKCAA
ncbi:MAG: tol-pal system protein YbgF [Parcubacteria group bacterium]